MSVQAMAWVFDRSASKGVERLVLLSLANHVGRDPSEGCWPSVETLAGDANCSPRSAQRALASLVVSGEVVVVRQGGLSSRDDRRPNRYWIPGLGRQTGRGDDLSPRDDGPAGMSTGSSPPPDDISRGDEMSPRRPGTAFPVDNPAENGLRGDKLTPRQPATGCQIRSDGVTDQVERGDNVVTRTVSEPSRTVADGKPSGHQATFDALMAACSIDTAQIPKSKRPAYSRAASELAAVGATADEIADRARRLTEAWGRDKLTPTSLLSHWAEFADDRPTGPSSPVDGMTAAAARNAAEPTCPACRDRRLVLDDDTGDAVRCPDCVPVPT